MATHPINNKIREMSVNIKLVEQMRTHVMTVLQ